MAPFYGAPHGKRTTFTLKWKNNKSELYSPWLYLQQCLVCLNLVCSAEQSIPHSEETFASISFQHHSMHTSACYRLNVFVKFNSQMLVGALRWLSTNCGVVIKHMLCVPCRARRDAAQTRAHRNRVFINQASINFGRKRFQRMLSCLLFFEPPSFFSCINLVDTQSRFMNTVMAAHGWLCEHCEARAPA